MKSLIAGLALLSSFSTFAAQVVSAKLDANEENILLNVRYGGGCKKHVFTIQLQGCAESMPVQCRAKLIEKTEGGFDGCEALISQTVVINLKAAGLDEEYYQEGSLTITGANDSKATVRLP